MNLLLLFRTLCNLKLIQILYQIKYRLIKPLNNEQKAPVSRMRKCYYGVTPIPKTISLFSGSHITFLNIGGSFRDWGYTDNGMLWAYNLNYMDWLNQVGGTFEEGAEWIDKFISEFESNIVGLDPYPIALRGINWIKFITKYYNQIDLSKLRRWNDSLYSQYKLLEKKLEWHLMGNHLLEDAYSLFIASIYFNDRRMYRRYSRLLKQELSEQILADGAHYEQSPMYHCILLDRLLDCYNISKSNMYFDGQDSVNMFLESKASLMLGYLESIVYDNGDIPLLNDSAFGVAPSPKDLFDYAERLGIKWEKKTPNESGYRIRKNVKFEAILDVGNITVSYQPGHSHADTLNYELRIEGMPFVVDTGISTYEKNARRQFERSTVAHNCVSPDGKDSSEVWGGFRVGRRCHCEILEETSDSITAFHDGFDKQCKRRFKIIDSDFIVEDWYEGDAVSYIHLAEGADYSRILVEGANDIVVKDYEYSTEYNKFHKGKVIEIKFNGYLKYTIR